MEWENHVNYHGVSSPLNLQTRNEISSSPEILNNAGSINEMSNAGANEESEKKGSLWQIIYTSFVLLLMFAALISDKVGADMVMMVALTLLMASEIISIQEALAGFANEGLLTVLVLFVVAAGISHTGALDWYMGKLLGRPNNAASAQLRLMLPIAVVSAFLNNTPVVAVMIPIVQRWGKNVGVSPQQLLIPLSFASILGGTCTLIGTSTNLVVVGLLQARYPGDEVGNVGLFDLGKYGVPIAMAGMAYVLIFSMFLIPGSSKFIGGSGGGAEVPTDLDDSILLGARLTKWSAAVNRTVQRSGLRDTDGVYLVSVHRAATGNVHRAVGQEFVLNVGDILYFTGLVEGFGQFCEDNGLEVITNEVEDSVILQKSKDEVDGTLDENIKQPQSPLHLVDGETAPEISADATLDSLLKDTTISFPAMELGINRLSMIPELDVEMGVTKESLAASESVERRRYINRIQDTIRGIAIPDNEGIVSKRNKVVQDSNAPPKIVAHSDTDDFVVVAISTPDRPGLLLDVSKTLIRLGLNFHRTEAMVVDGRSLSLWRCEVLENGVSDIEEIWSVLNAMLEVESGVEAIKSRGLRVVRAVIPKRSKLIGTNASETNFRKNYKAAIVAVQRDGKSVTTKLSQTRFDVGDVLVLQTSDDSPLLIQPPSDFYRKPLKSKRSGSLSKYVKKRLGSFGSLSDIGSSRHAGQSSDDDSIKTPIKESDPDDIIRKEFIGSPEESQPQQKIEFYVDSDNEDVSVGEASVRSETPNGDEEAGYNRRYLEGVWRDLAVAFTRSSGDVGSDDKEQGPATRDFLTAMEILPRSSLAKRTVGALGLDKVPGTFLVSIERPTKDESKRVILSSTRKILSGNVGDDQQSVQSLDESELVTQPAMIPVAQDQPLEEGDVLWFSGSAAAIGDLRKIPGMKSYVNEEVKKINEKVHDRRLVQAVIARRSKLVGKTVKEARFRSRFGAVVIAVHREGKRVQQQPGSIKLHAGDVLLLEAGPTFLKQNAENDNSFALLSEVQDSAPPRLKLLVPALLLAVAMLAVYTAGVASLLVCALIASVLMVCFGILSQQEVRDAINWEVYITIAAAFGIGTALTNSGVAGGVADGLVQLGQALGIGDAGLYGTVYFATFLISNVVTNNAAAALLFPIAMDAAEETGADRQLMSYTLMLGASASFMSPFGYTTNLLIYGPGGYKYVDFLRIGTPMQVVLWIISIIFISADPSTWYISWIATAMVLVIVSVMLVLDKSSFSKCYRYNTMRSTTDDKSS